ncbi:YciI family protein [Rhodococcus sp. C26F]|jgi:hypothetical protein|uniref:DGPFAETKE family protein n=1 Tax=Rhodococcus pyridinivorans KG-16 TaxID=1441730 RepID=A0A0V9UGP6_9NOCA|nr:YciI family protein [Rhodococcus pyridinivorans]KSZ57171.1 DGPFAETKE family protein [Rhodococcus pyridinivorans KG-16]MCR8692207.1 YciI family protein [Rhodococcus pyridinivorans]
MAQYLLSIYQPDGEPPSPEFLEPIMKKVAAWQNEIREAGVWVFSGGLHPPDTATVVRTDEGRTVTTDGPYIEGKEHLGGFDVIDVPDLDEALKWARGLADATTLPIEVRPLEFGSCAG